MFILDLKNPRRVRVHHNKHWGWKQPVCWPEQCMNLETSKSAPSGILLPAGIPIRNLSKQPPTDIKYSNAQNYWGNGPISNNMKLENKLISSATKWLNQLFISVLKLCSDLWLFIAYDDLWLNLSQQSQWASDSILPRMSHCQCPCSVVCKGH